LPFNAVAMNKVYLVEDTNIVITDDDNNDDDDAEPTTQLLNSAQNRLLVDYKALALKWISQPRDK
jgi:hypothetical protein